MKKLLIYIIIIFFSSLTFSFSEDISDFQIEGISVDDSVLDYFTNRTLKKISKEKMKTDQQIVYSKIPSSNTEAGLSSSYSDSYGKVEASENIC